MPASGERGCGDGSTPYAWLSSVALLPWLSSTSISIHSLLPPNPSICLSTVNSSPCPEIAPQSLNSSSEPLGLPGDQHSWPGYVGCSKDCLILIPLRLPQISCFTLSPKCFSSDSDSFPIVGIGPLLQFPHPLRAGPILLTLLFFPLLLHRTEFCMALYILFCWLGIPVCAQLVSCMHFCV